MSYLALLVVNGLVVGLIYSLMAAGLTLIFSVLKIVNFGHGALYMLGGYAAYYAIPRPSAFRRSSKVMIAMAALGLVGAILRTARPPPAPYTDRVERKDEYAIIVTFGSSIFLINFAILAFGPFSKSPPPFLAGALIAGPLVLPYDRLIAAGVALALLVWLTLFLSRTMLGQALDAVSQSRESAAVIGIDAKLMYTFAFACGAALAGGAGAR